MTSHGGGSSGAMQSRMSLSPALDESSQDLLFPVSPASLVYPLKQTAQVLEGHLGRHARGSGASGCTTGGWRGRCHVGSSVGSQNGYRRNIEGVWGLRATPTIILY